MKGVVRYDEKNDRYIYANEDGTVTVSPLNVEVLIECSRYNMDTDFHKWCRNKLHGRPQYEGIDMEKYKT